ncbi:Monocarboxylate transporter 14-like 1 [Homarus americanus]|uniref:Monocarboxylate transporter 14-like 1 n=1 Tax=Homarus americanus TaxID=6706 RepID=A0A8J5MZ90_HOMAM|nr:Monocarboxylate transporter 14-like 1 [Homarus americanus]
MGPSRVHKWGEKDPRLTNKALELLMGVGAGWSLAGVALIYSAFMVVWRLTGVALGTLTREFGFRRVAMTGTFLTATGLILSAFARSPEALFVFFSLGCGLGSGLSCVGYLILAQYFQKHRGLANTCLMAGAGLGHFFSPLLIRFLQDKYGFVGATMILGAIILHGFVGATLFHPVEWHGRFTKMKKPLNDPDVVSTLLPNTRVPENGPTASTTQVKEYNWPTLFDSGYLQQYSSATSAVDLASLSCNSVAAQANEEATSSPGRPVNCMCTLWRNITRVLHSVINDIRILKHPSCFIIALGSTLIVNGEANFTVLVPFAVQATGHSPQTAAWCVICVSALSDFSWFHMRLCYMIGMATLSISIIVHCSDIICMTIIHKHDFWCAIGIFYGLNNLLMTEIVGLHNLTSMYGARNFLGALGLRDVSGSYTVSMWVLAGMILTSFVSCTNMIPNSPNPSTDKPNEPPFQDQLKASQDHNVGGSRTSVTEEYHLQERQQKPEMQQLQEVREEPEVQEGPQAPDGGWGWMVAIGAFLNMLVIPMLSPSFGILFSSQLLEWQASSTTVAIIYSSFMVMWKLTGVTVGSLCKEFGFRRVGMTGTLLTSTCLTLCTFATSPAVIFIFFSLGCGMGAGLSCVGFLNLAQYFDKHRGLANTFLTAGIGLGHFSSPLFIHYLQNEYGFKGATMILGALILHGFVGATLYQPVKWHLKYPQKKKTQPDLEGVSLLLPQTEKSENTNLEGARSNGSVSKMDENQWSVLVTQEHLRKVNRDRHMSQCSYTSMASSRVSSIRKSDVDLASLTSIGSLASLANIKFPDTDDPARSSPEKGSDSCMSEIWETIIRVLRSIISDVGTLRHPSYLIIALATMAIIGGQANFNMIVPFALQTEGHSLQTAAWYLSVAGICNFLTRLCLSPLSDFSWFNMRLVYLCAIFTMGTSIIVFTFQTEVVGQLVVMGVWGSALGSFHSLSNLQMTRIVGVQNLTSMFGVIRDASGSYTITMWVLSGMIFISFILWLFMPAAQAYDQHQRAKEAEEKVTPAV